MKGDMRHLLVPFLVTVAVAAQTPRFDVVSIKPNIIDSAERPTEN